MKKDVYNNCETINSVINCLSTYIEILSKARDMTDMMIKYKEAFLSPFAPQVRDEIATIAHIEDYIEKELGLQQNSAEKMLEELVNLRRSLTQEESPPH